MVLQQVEVVILKYDDRRCEKCSRDIQKGSLAIRRAGNYSHPPCLLKHLSTKISRYQETIQYLEKNLIEMEPIRQERIARIKNRQS